MCFFTANHKGLSKSVNRTNMPAEEQQLKSVAFTL